MKKILGIMVLGLLLSGCNENSTPDDKLIVLNCKLKKGDFDLIIDLEKNTMKFFEWDPYTITSISETEIIANNLDQLTGNQLRHFLNFKRYGGELTFKQVYHDGKIYRNEKLLCKKFEKIF